MSELLPCPFCGSIPNTYYASGTYFVDCGVCSFRNHKDGVNAKPVLREWWNTRYKAPEKKCACGSDVGILSREIKSSRCLKCDEEAHRNEPDLYELMNEERSDEDE